MKLCFNDNRHIREAIFFALFFFILSRPVFPQNNIRISGTMLDSLTGQIISDASLYSVSKGIEIKTNAYGFFSYQAERDTPESFVAYKEGYKSKSFSFGCQRDTFITLKLNFLQLKEVRVAADSLTGNSVTGPDSRALVITADKLQSMPLLLGEKDIVRSLQYLPGVQASNEASAAINVRGGSADQNQYILDDVPIYNISHLFGFVSTFNPDIVKEASFYKGDFPARYGGKLSSVVDVKSCDGNDKKIGGAFAISPVSSKILLEGPVLKEKLTFVLSARRSFVDYLSPVIFQEFTDYDLYHFYDLNFKMKYILNSKNRLFASFYSGLDQFGSLGSSKSGGENGTLKWGNTGSSLRWNWIVSNTVFANTTVLFSNYKFQSVLESGPYRISYQSILKGATAKTDIDWLPSNTLRFRGGMAYTQYDVRPGNSEEYYDSAASVLTYIYKPKEFSLYAEGKIDLATRFHLMAGLRADFFSNHFTSTSIQPRASLDYDLTSTSFLHAGYSRTYQPMHLLTNTAAGIPSEMWVPALNNLQPEHADLLTIGADKSIKKTIHLSANAYYKTLKNIIDYKPGSRFLTISQDPIKNVLPDWTENVTQGNGKAYGAEFLFEKTAGAFSTLLSYTLSWSKRTFEEINFGEEFYSPFDHRHKLTIELGYRVHRPAEKKNIVELSTAWVYASASPVTIPSGLIENVGLTGQGIKEEDYVTQYNSYLRMQPFHHLDLAIRLLRAKDNRRTWEFGIYNAYNRKNAYGYTLSHGTNQFGQTVLYLAEKYYFTIFPYLSYAYKF